MDKFIHQQYKINKIMAASKLKAASYLIISRESFHIIVYLKIAASKHPVVPVTLPPSLF